MRYATGATSSIKMAFTGAFVIIALTFSGCGGACRSMTISSIFQDLKEVGVKLTPMSVVQIRARTRATVWTGSTATGKKSVIHNQLFHFQRVTKMSVALMDFKHKQIRSVRTSKRHPCAGFRPLCFHFDVDYPELIDLF